VVGPGFWLDLAGRRDEPRYSAPNPAFKTWNNCPPTYTVQDGLCKPVASSFGAAGALIVLLLWVYHLLGADTKVYANRHGSTQNAPVSEDASLAVNLKTASDARSCSHYAHSAQLNIRDCGVFIRSDFSPCRALARHFGEAAKVLTHSRCIDSKKPGRETELFGFAAQQKMQDAKTLPVVTARGRSELMTSSSTAFTKLYFPNEALFSYRRPLTAALAAFDTFSFVTASSVVNGQAACIVASC
jgi:hypothetical protein